MDEDCTWFVTQALWAGGFNDAVVNSPATPLTASSVTTWLPSQQRPSEPASLRGNRSTRRAPQPWPMSCRGYLESQGWATITKIPWSDNTAKGAQLGDIIAYDWDGGTLDFQHLAMVTSLNDQGYPSVSQHSEGRQNRYWSYLPAGDGHKGGWIEDLTHGKAVAYLIHIIY